LSIITYILYPIESSLVDCYSFFFLFSFFFFLFYKNQVLQVKHRRQELSDIYDIQIVL